MRGETGILGRCCNTAKRNGFIKSEMASDGNYTCGRAIRSGRDSSGGNGDILPILCFLWIDTLKAHLFIHHPQYIYALRIMHRILSAERSGLIREKKTIDLFGVTIPVQQLWNARNCNISEIFLCSKFWKLLFIVLFNVSNINVSKLSSVDPFMVSWQIMQKQRVTSDTESQSYVS